MWNYILMLANWHSIIQWIHKYMHNYNIEMCTKISRLLTHITHDKFEHVHLVLNKVTSKYTHIHPGCHPHIITHIHVYAHATTDMVLYTHIHYFTDISIHPHIHAHIQYIHVHVYLYTCTCMYIYIHVHYITCIFLHVHSKPWWLIVIFLTHYGYFSSQSCWLV